MKKSMRLGSGGRFAAVAKAAGRKKYGNKKMAKWAAAGKKKK